MKKLSAAAFQKARRFLSTSARPLERARFAHEFERAPRAAVLEALAAFQNDDGGFGRALEPDVRLPASSAICTLTGLDLLRELDASAEEPLVRRALAWVVERYDPEIPGWRCVPPEIDAHPHAGHWDWALHAPGGPWPHVLVPGARLLSHLEHWRTSAPDALRAAFLAHVATLGGDVGGDSLFYAATVDAPSVRARLRELAVASVSRDPNAWTDYVSKPLKLAPLPDSPLADVLRAEVQANLDWELDQQAADGAWEPNWSWRGAYPADWEQARREWRGVLTLERLRSLRAFGRIEGL